MPSFLPNMFFYDQIHPECEVAMENFQNVSDHYLMTKMVIFSKYRRILENREGRTGGSNKYNMWYKMVL